MTSPRHLPLRRRIETSPRSHSQRRLLALSRAGRLPPAAWRGVMPSRIAPISSARDGLPAPETTGYIHPDDVRITLRERVARTCLRGPCGWPTGSPTCSWKRRGSGRHYRAAGHASHLQHWPGDFRLGAGLRRNAATAVHRLRGSGRRFSCLQSERWRVAQESFRLCDDEPGVRTPITRTAWALSVPAGRVGTSGSDTPRCATWSLRLLNRKATAGFETTAWVTPHGRSSIPSPMRFGASRSGWR